MKTLLRLDRSEQVIDWIVNNKLSRADSRTDFIASEIKSGKASIWYAPPDTYLVISVAVHEDFRELAIRCLEGKNFVGFGGHTALLQLAKQEKCERIWCQTEKAALVRMLVRLGYVIEKEREDGFTELFAAV